jgi:acyl-CoA synthetase (AMP-forming)/AMP-acid ligase II
MEKKTLFKGTTGKPKGATLTHHNIVNNAYFVGLRAGYHEKVLDWKAKKINKFLIF